MGYLQQTAVSGSNKTIFEEAAAGMTEIQHAKHELETIQEQIAAMSSQTDTSQYEKLLRDLDRAITRCEAVGGFTQEKKVASVLKGLGFNDLEKRCDECSGGWQMRIAFAKLLLSEPKLCLMDEPGMKRYMGCVRRVVLCDSALLVDTSY